MGRYRQWLHHQQIEQQLHTQLQHLETELSRWQQQTTIYDGASNTLSEDNQLYIALIANTHMNTPPTASSDISDEYSLFSLSQSPPGAIPESMPAIPTTEKPALESTPSPGAENNVQLISQSTIPSTPFEEPVSSLPHAELALQPEDMMPYFDALAPTEPQRELPHWLHTLIESSLQNNQKTGAMNEELLRSNRLYQRWFERWGLPSEAPSPESETVKRQTLRKEGEP